MTAAATSPLEAPAGLRSRLQCCSRYAALIADQLEALEQGDSARVRELGEQRRELEQEMGAQGPEDLRLLLEQGLDEVEHQLGEDELLRSHWTSLQDDAIRATRTVRPSRHGRGRYPTAGALEAQLDVRF